jgi:hypothetical protein
MTRLDQRVRALDNASMSEDARQYAPSVARNRDPIWSVLQPELPTKGLVLEIASGSGEHAVHFAQRAGSDLIFQPSDADEKCRASIDAWRAAAGPANPYLALGGDDRFGAGGCARALARRISLPLWALQTRGAAHRAQQ